MNERVIINREIQDARTNLSKLKMNMYCLCQPREGIQSLEAKAFSDGMVRLIELYIADIESWLNEERR